MIRPLRAPDSSRLLFAISMTVVVLILAIAPVYAQSEGSQPAKKVIADYTELEKAPPKAVKRTNPLRDDPDAVAAGGKLYELHCAECHGELANGGRKGPSLRAPEVQQATPGAIFWLLTNGVVRRGMPVWSKLPEPQRWQLVSYIKSLTPANAVDHGGRSPSAGDKSKDDRSNDDKNKESKPPGR